MRWDPALRAMYTGRPIVDPATARLEARHGAPLDETRAFRLDDDPEDMAHFLRTAGYLLASSVFAADEIAAFREGAEAVRRTAPKGDKLSWWGKNAHGEEVLCRVTNAGRHPAFRGLHRDPRVQQLVGLSDAELVARAERSEESVTVIFKNPDMTEGLSDIPWHRDCGMGGHAVMCPVLIVSIFIRPATAESGELRVLPGSWQGACGFIDARHKDAPKGIALAAGAGDVSLHYGDVMHAAPPPTGRGPFRESVVMAFAPPGASHHRGESSYNDVLHQSEDGQVEHLTAVAKRA